MFLRNAWYSLGWSDELDLGRLHPRLLAGEPLVALRHADGTLSVLEDRCAHRAAPLSRGRFEADGSLRCQYHGVRFDGRTGQGLEVPGQAKPSEQMRVRSYPVTEVEGWAFVWMGDPAQADPALLPAVAGPRGQRWSVARGQMDYDANYQLINDNLCDFSHVAYVHVNSFGGGQEGVVEQFAHRPTIEPLARGIRVTRWSEDSPAPPFLAEADVDGLLDLYMTYDYLVPGVLLMWTGLFPRGTARALQHAKPTIAPLHSAFSSQVVTPIDARHTRYYFTWGPSTAENRPFLKDVMVKLAATAFEEDRLMIEAQQRVLDRTPAVTMQPTVHDRGPNLMRGVVRRLLEAEAAPA